jgi:hypothetical protein
MAGQRGQRGVQGGLEFLMTAKSPLLIRDLGRRSSSLIRNPKLRAFSAVAAASHAAWLIRLLPLDGFRDAREKLA